MKKEFYYVTIRDVPGHARGFLMISYESDYAGTAMITDKPMLFEHRAVAEWRAEEFEARHGGKAKVRAITLQTP